MGTGSRFIDALSLYGTTVSIIYFNRMQVINYQPSYPTDSQSQSERTQKDIHCAPAHMLPVRTLCPTYDPSECASRPNQVQAMYRNETAERLACLVMRCSAAILALECSPCWILKGQAARG